MFLGSMPPLSAGLLAALTAILFFGVAPLADKPSTVNAHRILANDERVVAAFVTMSKQRYFIPDLIAPCACHLALYGSL
jgi:hypothetical protein